MQKRLIGASMLSENSAEKGIYQLSNTGQFLLTDRDCADPTADNDFGVQVSWRAKVFVQATWSKALCLLVYLAFHTYLQFQMGKKETLAELLCLKEVANPAYYKLV